MGSLSSNVLGKKVDLPHDILASKALETERRLDAITLGTHSMESDLREALINDDAFEAMDDDFVMEALKDKPDGQDNTTDYFDYDAHIAQLLSAANGVPKFKGDLSDDEGEEDDELVEEKKEEGAEGEMDTKDKDIQLLDAQFEKIMLDYDEDQIGGLSDCESDTKVGQ